MIPVTAPRPPKRARINADGSDPLPPPQVKGERSPSPLFVERRLVTSGTKRFAPLPDDCLPSCTEYKQNRSEWVARCVKGLEALNLVSERNLIRDDGLVIDWRSHVPVWSDTLRPDPLDLAATIMLAHRSNAQWHRDPTLKESPVMSVAAVSIQERSTSAPISGGVSDAEPPAKKRFPVPPRPSSKRRNNSSQPIPANTSPSGPGSSPPCAEQPRFPDETPRSPPRDRMSSLADQVPVPSDISARHGEVAVPPRPPSRDVRSTPCTSSAAEETMSEMTLDYLRRYVQTYEADRASLASAYARNASFAYRAHQIVQNISEDALPTWAPSPLQCFSSGPKRTRLDIVTTLLTLPCLHSNAASPGTAQIEYDIFYLGAKHGMFVVCRVVTWTRTVVHNFVLQRKDVDVEDAVVEGVWPLTATAHQILVFQT